MSRHTIRIESEELEELLNEVNNKSEIVREGLRLWQVENKAGEYADLDDEQAYGYEWLLDRVGAGGRVNVEAAKNELAQEISKDMRYVMNQVIKPLERKGYLRVRTGIERVDLVVTPPEVSVDG